MKINVPEISENKSYYYTIEKSMYGGYVLYIELESDLRASGTLDDVLLKHHWKPLTPKTHIQKELIFKD